jgi:hypothetical protein
MKEDWKGSEASLSFELNGLSGCRLNSLRASQMHRQINRSNTLNLTRAKWRKKIYLMHILVY